MLVKYGQKLFKEVVSSIIVKMVRIEKKYLRSYHKELSSLLITHKRERDRSSQSRIEILLSSGFIAKSSVFKNKHFFPPENPATTPLPPLYCQLQLHSCKYKCVIRSKYSLFSTVNNGSILAYICCNHKHWVQPPIFC